MNPHVELERAVLLSLCASPIALTTELVRKGLGQFTAQTPTLSDVTAVLERLERAIPPEVKGTSSRDFGSRWKETDDGRLRVL